MDEIKYKPLDDLFEEIEIEAKRKKSIPEKIRRWLRRMFFSDYSWIKEKFYKLRCFVWHRWTTIKPRTLDHTYHEPSDMMPHFMFELLCIHIEKQLVPSYKPYNIFDSAFLRKHARHHRKLIRLYLWWTKRYLPLMDFLDKIYKMPISKIKGFDLWLNMCDPKKKKDEEEIVDTLLFFTMEELDKELCEKMHELIKVHGIMWT